MESLQGRFLVASPHLADGNFNRSVVLMVKHDDEGALGLVLNRPTTNLMADVWKLVAGETLGGKEPIYVGGPVTTALFALHILPAASEMEVTPGVYFSAHKDHLLQIVEQPDQPSRFFMGYSGWGAGQLEGELEAGGWLVPEATATPELIFGNPEELWEKIVREIALDILSPVVPIKHAPHKPGLN